MTGLISFVLLAMGGISMISGGMLEEEGRRRPANIAIVCGTTLLFCAWVLA